MLKNTRFFKKTLTVVSALALTVGLVPLSYSLAAPVAKEYVNDFSSQEDLQDFDFYYAPDDNPGEGVQEDASAHWQWNADGTVTRINNVNDDGNYGARSSIMVLKGYQFENFEATLTFKYGSTWGWNVLGFRQETAGKDFRQNTGAGAYIDQEAVVHLWGNSDLGGDKQNGSKAELPMSDTVIDKTQPITMTVRVVGNKVQISANGKLAYEYTHEGEGFVKSGYLSIQVTANDSVIDKLTVKRLDSEGNVLPLDPVQEAASVETVANVTVQGGTSKEEALAQLPATVKVTDTLGNVRDCAVTWECAEYNGDAEGAYDCVGTLTMPDELLTNPNDLKAAAKILVVVEEEDTLKVAEVPSVEGLTVANGTTKAEAAALLPETVEVTDNLGAKHSLKVTWDCADYDGKLGGDYTFVGTLTMDGELQNPDNKTLQAVVTVQAYTMYVNDFNSIDDLKDFDAYFLAATNTPEKEDASAHWTVENGVLKRVNDINAEGATSNISSLVLKDYQFQNFEATLTYKDGLTNWGWTVLGFRQQTPGNFFILDGAGAYIDVAGQGHLWGFASVAGPHDGNKLEGYVQGQAVTLKVRVVNQSLKLYAGETLLLEKELPEDFNFEGFLSMQVVGNDSSIDRLTVTRLDDSGNPLNLDGSQPQTKPDTDPDTDPGTDPDGNPDTGVGADVVIPALALAALSGAAAVLCFKKRR